MKKLFTVLNALFLAAMTAGMLYYRMVGGLSVKAAVSGTFVLFGLINCTYAFGAKAPKRYPVLALTGLAVAMLGDVTLGKSFIAGAGLFALGHVMYFLAFCCLKPFRGSDAVFGMAIFAVSAAVLLLYPAFHFGSDLIKGVCVGYAFLISCMLGKAVSNLLRERSGLHALIMAAALLFFFSDLMLVLVFFAGAPRIADTLCLFTYYPAQTLLAHSIYHFANRR